MNQCPICAETLKMAKLSCEGCHIYLEGDFYMPRLARLSQEHQKFVEALVLSGGNLKELTGEMDVSYPTLRKRLDTLIEAMSKLQNSDKKRIESILECIEAGDVAAEEGLRHIKEINGEL